MSSYASVNDHRGMVFDDVRNAAYADALAGFIKPDSVVLDLGAGLGIHGLMAAARGARRVYLVDPSPVVTIASKVAADNGLAEKVTIIQKPIQQANLPEPVDFIISVLTGNFLLEEDLLPSLFCARDRYLKPGGVLLPDCGEMQIAPVSAAQYYENRVSCWSAGDQEIDFSQVQRYASNSLFFDSAKTRSAAILAEPKTIARLDFSRAVKAECSSDTTFLVEQDGDCHGFLGWFRMRLGEKWLSTSPQEPALHWSQVFLPLDPILHLNAGEQVGIRLVRPQFGEWSWICQHEGVEQRHSTFYSRAMSLDQLRCHSKEHRVGLSVQGELARFILEHMNGLNSIKSIFERVVEEFGGQYSSQEELERQVQSTISSYGK